MTAYPHDDVNRPTRATDANNSMTTFTYDAHRGQTRAAYMISNSNRARTSGVQHGLWNHKELNEFATVRGFEAPGYFPYFV
jgi:YD repeat-containing protein